MCKVGDIIVVEEYMHAGRTIKSHSFVVVGDENGTIQGLEYDFVANVLSSFKDDEQKARKLKFPGNFPVANDDTVTDPDNGKSGFLKTDQMYYFSKDKIKYRTIGNVLPDIMDIILEFINSADFPVQAITDNL